MCLSETRLYKIWYEMKKRCFNPKSTIFKYYGGRGISVCEEWMIYRNFEDWALTNGYTDDLTLDRIDNDGNYCPENCRWADRLTQANNKSNNHMITYEGKTQSLADWAREKGIDYKLLSSRVRSGWNFERAIKEPVGANSQFIRYEYQGESRTLTEWERIMGFNKGFLIERVKEYGYSFEDAITKDIKNAPVFVTVNGKTQSFRDACKEYGLQQSTAWRRINVYGWSVEEAFTTPVRGRKTQAKSA